jgi:glutathione S-transferase
MRFIMSDTLKLYHAPASPNSRRVRIFIAEKGIAVPLVEVDLGEGEQHGESYRAINPRRVAGPYDYDQIPALVERSRLRLKNFYADLDAHLTSLPFVAGDHFSGADITGLVTVDFATKAMSFPPPDEHKALRRWFEKVSSRPSAAA